MNFYPVGYIVACQAHPTLVNIGLALVPPFIFDSPLAHIHVLDYKSICLRTKGLTDRISLRLGGLARDNIFKATYNPPPPGQAILPSDQNCLKRPVINKCFVVAYQNHTLYNAE